MKHKEYFIFKGSSNFYNELTIDDETLEYRKNKPEGFYDIVSEADTVEGAIRVIEYSAYELLQKENEQLKAKLEKAKEALRFYANDVYWNKTSVGYYDRIDCSDTNLLIDGQVGGKRARAALKETEEK